MDDPADSNLNDETPVRQFSTGTLTAAVFLAAVIFSSYQWRGTLSVLFVSMFCGAVCFLIAGWRQQKTDHYQWIMLGLFCLVLALLVGAGMDPGAR